MRAWLWAWCGSAASLLPHHAHSHAHKLTCFAFFPTDFWGKERLLAVYIATCSLASFRDVITRAYLTYLLYLAPVIDHVGLIKIRFSTVSTDNIFPRLLLILKSSLMIVGTRLGFLKHSFVKSESSFCVEVNTAGHSILVTSPFVFRGHD